MGVTFPSRATCLSWAVALLIAVIFAAIGGVPSAFADNTFSGPLVSGYSADPDVVYYNGYYYMLYNQGIDSAVTIRKATSLGLLASSPNITVYTADSQTQGLIGYGGFFFHYNSHWYIYDNEFSVSPNRAFVLESSGDDPTGPYSFAGDLAGPGPGNNSYVNDAVNVGGQLYSIQTADSPSGHGLYIAKMSNPTTVSSSFTLISDPTNAWECGGGTCIDEGGSIVVRNGTVFDIFSAGVYLSADYCVGLLTASASADLTQASAWTKSSGCVFSRNNATGEYGPGSMTWFTSPDGSQNWVAYHVKTTTGATGSDRQITAKQVTWDGSGNPVFGSPIALGTAITLPSGDPGSGASTYQAENGTVTDAQIRSSSSASGGEYVGGIDNSDSSVAFTVNAATSGTYAINVFYANGWSSAGTHNLSVNGGSPIVVNYPVTGQWGSFSSSQYVTVTVNLNAGSNTLTFSHATNYAELDAITVNTGSGGSFTQVPGGLIDVSVGSDGTVVGVAPDDRVWEYTGVGSLPWTEITGKSITRVAVRSANDIWGLASDGSIWRYTGTWNQIAGGAVDIAAGADGSVWATASSGGTWQWTGGTSSTNWPTNWSLVTGSAPGGNSLLVEASGKSSSDLWGVASNGNIWHYDGSSWTQISGTLTWVSEGSDGTVYGVNSAGQTWKYNGSGWTQVNMSLTQISVGTATNIWGVDNQTQIWKTG
jgi:GH43 family beta-xylosidase